jgi:hypothetical protein
MAAPGRPAASAGGGGSGGESIYSWVREAPPPPVKPPMYHSKHDPLAKPYAAASTFTHVTRKREFGTIGREVKPTVATSRFLKAHELTGHADPPGGGSVPLPRKFERAEPPRKPALPRREEAPLHGLRSERDFVTGNAVEAILTLPKRTRAADPDWLRKPEYGAAPSYLARVKGEIEAEHEFIQSMLDQRQMEEEAASGVRMRELTSGEREELLDALKAKWDAVNARYQKTTFKAISTSTSTIGEIRWKERCETQLTQIERDIARLSVRAPIFVVDDADAGAAGAALAAAAAATGGGGGGEPAPAGGARGGAGGAGGATGRSGR